VPAETIIKAARMYGSSGKAGIYYTMGITQHAHGTENVFSIANLALLTGNLGKESVGVNPLRGQNNVQGATDMGCIPNLFPGYQGVAIAENKQKFEDLWKVKLSEKAGMTATEMIPAAEKGTMKAMYIMGENPAVSDPDTTHTIKALKKLDLLVVQDIFMTETAELAHVVFPAVSYAEKDGTFTNTERRVQRVRKALNSPGIARDDSYIIGELAKKMGHELSHTPVADVFSEIGQAWPAFGGMSHARLEEGGLQWPCPTPNHSGTCFLFKDGFPRGKGRFTLVTYKPSVELADKDYPFVLTTGRLLFQYHTGSMTRRVKEIDTVSPEAYIEINTADAKDLALDNGMKVKVSSRRGSITVKAVISKRPAKGVVFIPFHFKEAAANVLTSSTSLDPIAKIPSYKVSAVKLEKA
jgi:predicted molibdopterin-dependent oxidoreductase YjgC